MVSTHDTIAGALADNGPPLRTNGAELSTATKTLDGISALLTRLHGPRVWTRGHD